MAEPNTTPHYQLEKPDEADFYDITVQHRNTDKIDAALADPARHLAPGERDHWNAMTPRSRAVNGKALASDITLSAADVGARPDTWTPTAADVGGVPASRKVNSKALTADISLSAADVNARPSTWNPAIADCPGTLAVAKGGTGQTTAAGARNALGLGNTTGALPVANGGTGVTNLVGTDYGTTRVRAISILAAAPGSLGDGCIAAVYS